MKALSNEIQCEQKAASKWQFTASSAPASLRLRQPQPCAGIMGGSGRERASEVSDEINAKPSTK